MARPAPPATGTPDAGPETQLAGDSAFDASAFEQRFKQAPQQRWIGWRLRLLVLATLLGCLAVFMMMRLLATSPLLDATWQPDARGQLRLVASPEQALQAHVGRVLVSVAAPGQPAVPVDALALQRTARWLVDDTQRERYLQLQDGLARALAQGRVNLRFADGSTASVPTPPRGHGHLGLLFWPISGFALLLYLVGVAVPLLRPRRRNLLYTLMVGCQAVNLLLIAAEPARGLGQPAGLAQADLVLRLVLDVITSAAAVVAYALHPRPLPHRRVLWLLAGAVVLVWAATAATGLLQPLWGWTQAVVLGLGAAATAVIAWSYRLEANPFVAVMRRFTALALATLALVTLAIAATHHQTGAAPAVAAVSAVIWYLFFASLLLLVPFLSRSRQVVLKEFALLAGIGTVTSSLALLAMALFALGPLAAISLALALALLVYVAARQWLLNQMVGASVLTTERTFEQLYRVAREVQDRPDQAPRLLAGLLRDLFEPQEMLSVPRRLPAARVVGAGSALYVPLPGEGGSGDLNQILIMRHASRGQRIFTHDDARLAERVVDQVCRAVAYDRAVEQGRAEERQRIAQDLHDDIGARLLTLMYKAGDREIEDYIRHTLQDLKTLTRGLAAAHHTLGDAAGEWKADLTQRLTAARLRLGWSFNADVEVPLSVGQWSGLTRILRELVSNAIAHAEASRVEVSLQLERGVLTLRVADDGRGGDPQAWSHGLGLGGVRKRVRALGGRVSWQANPGGGILCEVVVPGLGTAGRLAV